jgi:ATP-dependent protease HslVU (ClpYQ) ATPase subunit
MTNCRSRAVDAELSWRMTTTGAVLVDGPKAVGKTETASRLATTEPAALAVITAGKYTYRRADGVLVIPITALGP